MNINERLEVVYNTLKAKRKVNSKGDFADKLGYSRTYLSEMFSGARAISENTSTKLEILFEINSTWFNTGNGEMFLTTADKVKAIAQETGKPHEEKGIFSKVAGLFKKIPEPEKEDLMTFNEIIEWEEDLLRRYEEQKKKNQEKNKND